MALMFYQKRHGATLLELLMFLAFFAVSSGVLLSFFFLTSEQRIRQQVITTVDQGGVQLLQSLQLRVRDAERIMAPAATEASDVLALQMADESLHPTVLGLSGGVLYAAEADTLIKLSSENITVSDFSVTNTSATDEYPSVLLSFTASGALQIGPTDEYARWFEVLVRILPDDSASPPCSCADPVCTAGEYEWQYCVDSVCTDSPVSLPCQ